MRILRANLLLRWMAGAWNDLIKLVNRWRLEKADPTCVSDCAVVEPITYYIDPSVRACTTASHTSGLRCFVDPIRLSIRLAILLRDQL